MCVENHTEGPPHPCSNMYILLMLLSSMKEVFHFKWRLISNAVCFSTTPEAGEGILTHLLCVSLVSLLMGNCVQDMSLMVGQYHLALFNPPQEESYEHLFGGLLF